MLSRENNADGYMQNKEDSARIMDFATRRIDAGFLVFFCVNSCSKVVLSKAVNIIRNIEAPEGDGNDLLRPR